MLHRYWQFEYFFVDNVYFHSALWKLSRFEAPIVHHPLLGEINIFGDHFHPTIMFFAALYWLLPKHEIIFVGMALVFGASAYLGMQIAFKLLKHKTAVLGLLFSYFVYLGTQQAFIYGFHEINLTPLFFMATMYAVFFKKKWWYWLSLGLLLLTKESMAAMAIGIGLFLLLALKQKSRGLLTVAISIGYFLVATRVLIPYFSGGNNLYTAVDIPLAPYAIVDRFTVPSEKIETFIVSMATFGFLPLLNVATLPLVLQDFILRYVFAIPGSVQYTLQYHYGIGLVPILFFSSLWSLHQWEKRLKQPWIFWGISGLLVLSSLYFHQFYKTRGPLALVYNRGFYGITENNRFLWDFLQNVPKEGTIMTQNHLGLALAQYDVQPICTIYNEFLSMPPDYLVYDLREGQNPNNFFPSTEEEFRLFTQNLIHQNYYRIKYQQDEQYILEKTPLIEKVRLNDYIEKCRR